MIAEKVWSNKSFAHLREAIAQLLTKHVNVFFLYGYIRSVCVAVAIGRPLVEAAASWLMSKNGSICRVNGSVMRSTKVYVGIRCLEPVNDPELRGH